MLTKDEVEKRLDEVVAKPYEETSAALPEWDAKHNDFENKELIIVDARETVTQYGDAYIGVCIFHGQVYNILFGGEVLVKKIGRMIKELPVSVTIVKTGSYWDFA